MSTDISKPLSLSDSTAVALSTCWNVWNRLIIKSVYVVRKHCLFKKGENTGQYIMWQLVAQMQRFKYWNLLAQSWCWFCGSTCHFVYFMRCAFMIKRNHVGNSPLGIERPHSATKWIKMKVILNAWNAISMLIWSIYDVCGFRCLAFLCQTWHRDYRYVSTGKVMFVYLFIKLASCKT